MKYNQYKYLVAALCAANATISMAQEQEATNAIDTLKAESKVQLAFREVAESEALLGVSSVNYRDVIAKDYMTYPFYDLDAFVAGGTITWGGSYLVLIDGVPRAINNIKPDEIETISFLKGAAAVALYGSHASKGAILVTTKRGTATDLAINVRANTGWNVAKSYPKYLGSAEYMVLYNEARVNDGLDPLYSESDIYHYASGENPYRYPNVDFYSSEYLKKTYNRSDVTAEIEGGNDKAQFYTNISFYNVGTPFKKGEAKDSYTNRFNVRGNVDINISDYIKARIDANVTFYNQRGYSGANYWEAASTWRPNRIAPFIPISYIDENATDALTQVKNTNNTIDGQFIAGTSLDPSNVFADMYISGSSKYVSRQFQSEVGLDIDMSFLTEGLSFHSQFAMDYASDYTERYNDKYKSFEPIWSNYNGKDVIIGFKETGTKDEHTGDMNLDKNASNQTFAFDARFNYDRTFGEHSIGAIALVRGFQYRYTGKYHSESDASLGFNLHYDFAKRYFVDLTGSVVHTAKLAKDKRNTFSPAVTLGWNIAKESFMDGSIFDNLTLSASASNLANDIDIEDYNMYVGTYSETGAWWAWTDQSQQSTVAKRGQNDDLDFIRNKEIAVGLNASLLNKMFTFKANAFINRQEGLLITSASQMPSYMMSYYPESSFIPYINYNEDMRKGVEFALGYNKKIGEVDFSALLTGMYSTNEAVKRDDTAFEEDYQKREGKYLDGRWGYECLGFFKDESDIAASPDQSSFGQTIKPGDLKYKDQNGDGVIDSKDQVELGEYGNPFCYGIGLTAKYKGFTLFVAGYGSVGATASKQLSYYMPTGDNKYSVEARNRWTPETANSAKAPRLTTTAGQNNAQSSDFWTYKHADFNIGKVQLTYDFPATLFAGRKVLHGAQVYVSGSDLLKLSKEREYEELNIGSAPQNRFYNLGVKVTF